MTRCSRTVFVDALGICASQGIVGLIATIAFTVAVTQGNTSCAAYIISPVSSMWINFDIGFAEMTILLRSAMLLAFGCGTFVAGGIYGEDFMDNILCVSGVGVVDGDTIRCERRYVRLDGFDAPEPNYHNTPASWPEQCRRDANTLGRIATDRLKQLVASAKAAGTMHVEPMLYIKGGKKGKVRKTRNRRPIATLLINGKNAGDTMISENLARPYKGKKKPDWCAIITADPALQAMIRKRLETEASH